MDLISLYKGNDYRNIIIILKTKKRVKRMKKNKVIFILSYTIFYLLFYKYLNYKSKVYRTYLKRSYSVAPKFI
jgi:hypothetical protein